MSKASASLNIVKLDEVPDLLTKLYLNGKFKPSILLLGAPGIGKSDIVRHVAKKIAEAKGLTLIDYKDLIIKHPRLDELIAQREEEIRANKPIQEWKYPYFIYHDTRLTEVEPSDLLGVPSVVRRDHTPVYTAYVPLAWARILSVFPGLLFLDELTNVQRSDVISAAFKILLDRSAGEIKFHDDVIIVSAGNPPRYSAVARPLPAPLINRMLVIEVEPPTLESWRNFMDRVAKETGRSWYKPVYAFLKSVETELPKYFYPPSALTSTLSAYPSPRSWSHAAWVLEELSKYAAETKIGTITIPYLQQVIAGFVGDEAAQKFIDYLMIFAQVDIDAILAKPELFESEAKRVAKSLNMTEKNVQLGILTKIALKLEDAIDHGEIKKFVPFLKHILAKHVEMFALLIPHDAIRSHKLVMLLKKENEGELATAIVQKYVSLIAGFPLRKPHT
jgi:MoxR-like ATPase